MTQPNNPNTALDFKALETELIPFFISSTRLPSLAVRPAITRARLLVEALRAHQSNGEFFMREYRRCMATNGGGAALYQNLAQQRDIEFHVILAALIRDRDREAKFCEGQYEGKVKVVQEVEVVKVVEVPVEKVVEVEREKILKISCCCECKGKEKLKEEIGQDEALVSDSSLYARPSPIKSSEGESSLGGKRTPDSDETAVNGKEKDKAEEAGGSSSRQERGKSPTAENSPDQGKGKNEVGESEGSKSRQEREKSPTVEDTSDEGKGKDQVYELEGWSAQQEVEKSTASDDALSEPNDEEKIEESEGSTSSQEDETPSPANGTPENGKGEDKTDQPEGSSSQREEDEGDSSSDDTPREPKGKDKMEESEGSSSEGADTPSTGSDDGNGEEKGKGKEEDKGDDAEGKKAFSPGSDRMFSMSL